MKKRKWILSLLLAACLFLETGCASTTNTGETNDTESTQTQSMVSQKTEEEQWEKAEHSPYGTYPETVEYTLGKISGANNSNMPVGDTYEDNAYTRYLKKMLNIQNQDEFELEDGPIYEQAVELAIEDKNIPDVMVVNGRENLKKLIQRGLVEDLTDVYEECTTNRIKEMYESYGTGVLESATFGGKLYAFPDTVIDHGSMLLWLRKDWIDKLGVAEPQTLEEGMEIVRQFVEADMAGNGETIGLACSTGLVSETSSTYGVDPIFTEYGSYPREWIVQQDETVVYGSVTNETKQALEYLHELYENGTIDSRFLLRKTENLDDMIMSGKCGAVFGNWWAPNNPLSIKIQGDTIPEWKPYLLSEEEQIQTLESYNDWQYVVVRKGYSHPEIVGKIISVLFDYTRYSDRKATEINSYFSLNVDPTARPININVDYWDVLYQTTEHIQEALDGTIQANQLSGIERAYYETCKSYLNGSLTTVNAWAAYASRIQAVSLLPSAGRGKQTLSMGEADGELPQNLQDLERETFLQIVCGDMPIEYFDEFVQEWYEAGGREITAKIQAGYEGTK